MSIAKETLGAAIKQVRLARGLTQIELAEAAGLSKGGNSIALIEQGKRFVSVDSLNALAAALKVPPACLAILGSQKLGSNKAVTEFVESLQEVIHAVLDAQESLSNKEKKPQKKVIIATSEKNRSRPSKRHSAVDTPRLHEVRANPKRKAAAGTR